MKALLILLSLFSLVVVAEPQLIKSNVDEKIKNSLVKLGLTASEISKSEADGLIEVLTDRGLFYFTANGKHMIHGKVYDIDNDLDNITEKSLAKVRIAGLKEFKNSMVVFPAKNEKYKVTVFTDTTCGYCRKLHAQIEGYNDLGITIQYLAFPRSGINGPTFNEMTSIWCAVDQQDAMTNAKNGIRTSPVQTKLCKAPIAEQYSMGMQVGVTGTPAIIFDDGSMIPGYQDPAQLFAALASK